MISMQDLDNELKNRTDAKEAKPSTMHETVHGSNDSSQYSIFPEGHVPGREGLQKSLALGGSMLVPEAKLFSLIGSKLPQTGLLKKISDYGLNVTKGATSGATYDALNHENPLEGGKVGGEWSAALGIPEAILGNANPLARFLARGITGAALGYGLGQASGNPKTGASIGLGLGSLSSFLPGQMKQAALYNTLGSEDASTLQQAISRKQSAQSAGVPLTMLEALGTPKAQRQFNDISTSGPTAKKMYEYGMQRQPKEEAQIKDLMESISPNGSQANVIQPLYQQAFQNNVPARDLAKLLQNNSTVKKAFHDITKDTEFGQNKLKNISPTNLEYINQVKKFLDTRRETALKNEGSGRANVIGASTKELIDLADKSSPSYVKARNSAQNEIMKNKIENSFNKANISGSNFNDFWLSDKKKYNDLYSSLADIDNPSVQTPAQKKLQAMKESLPYLLDPISAQTQKNAAKSGISIFGSAKELAGHLLKDTMYRQYHNAIYKLMTNPNWDKEVANISKIKNAHERGLQLGKLLSRIGTINQLDQEGQ